MGVIDETVESNPSLQGAPVMRKSVKMFAAAVFALAITTSAGEALQYDRLTLDHSSKILLMARGRINNGDTQRLLGFLLGLPAGERIAGLIVDSPGGGLVEAEALAAVIRRGAFPLFVPPGGQCSSACFLLFAAAPQRFVAIDAAVGVHRANENGSETAAAKKATAAMAKDAWELGVPDRIIAKLVQTPPNQKSWLSSSELATMDVLVIPGASPATTRAGDNEGVVSRKGIEGWVAVLNTR